MPPPATLMKRNLAPYSTPRVFTLPEVFRLIIDQLPRPDRARLLTISRYFFTSVVSTVWHTVEGPDVLLKLLPNIDSAKTDDPAWIESLQSLDHRFLDRFELYAPYVRSLTSEFTMEATLLSGAWDALLKAVPNRPLLPNLEAFMLSSLHKDERNRPITFTSAFLCETLVCVHISEPKRANLDPLLAYQLMERVSHQCPHIHTLQVHAGGYITSGLSNHDPHSLIKTCLSTTLPRLGNLRTLGCGCEILDADLLVLLGSLPNLESLIIGFAYHQQRVAPSNVSFPDNSFPAIKHLGIHCESARGALELWKIQPLVRRIVSVAIKVDFGDNTEACHLICTICRYSTRVTDLQIDLTPNIIFIRPILLSSAAVESLRRLPLQRVQLTYVKLGPECHCEQLAMALPNVEYLDFPEQYFRFQDLVLVATYMPKLYFLGICQDLDSWPSEDQLQVHPPIARPSAQALPLYLKLSFKLHDLSIPPSMGDGYFDIVPRALLRLWPSGVHCSFAVMASLRHALNLDSEQLGSINATIKQLCLPKTFHTPSDFDVTRGWKYTHVHPPSSNQY